MILSAIILLSIAAVFIWYYSKGFGSRGTVPFQMSFVINGETFKAEHSTYVRYGEGYYLPLKEAAEYLGLEEKSSFNISGVSVKLGNDEYTYDFHSRSLLKNGAALEDCGNAFMMRERSVFVSTLFLEKALNLRLRTVGDDNRVFILPSPDENGDTDYSWLENNRYIAHALGGIEGKSYTNSLEAFEENYKKGLRLFEVDLEYTSDGELVLIHDWERERLKELFGMPVPADNVETPLSLKEFKSQTIYGKYTPLTYQELIGIMKDHPDMYLVLDGKYSDEERVLKEYGDIVSIAEKTDPEILKRVIPQIYNESMYDWVMQTYNWKSIILTWYLFSASTVEPEHLFEFCTEKGIQVCAMKDSLENALLDKEAMKRDIKILVYTVNEESDRDRLFNNGVSAIYTDFLYEN